MRPLVVGFDLDMTLIDTRPGIAAVWDALSAETGVAIDSAAAVSPARAAAGRGAARSGSRRTRSPPPATGSARSTRRWRSSRSPALPGAREAVDAVRRHGGRVVVVTGKYEPNARLHLDHLGLDVDDVVGWLWGPQKAEALLEHGATVYVGDHVGDIEGARAAGARQRRACRPARSARTSCARPAPTSSSTT